MDIYYTKIDNRIIDELMPKFGKDQILSALPVIIAIARKTAGFHKDRDRISKTQIMEMTGLTKKTVNKAIEYLLKNRLISIGRNPTKSLATEYYLSVYTDILSIPQDNGWVVSIPLEGDLVSYMRGSKYPSGGVVSIPTKEKKEKKENIKKEIAGSIKDPNLKDQKTGIIDSNQTNKEEKMNDNKINPNIIPEEEEIIPDEVLRETAHKKLMAAVRKGGHPVYTVQEKSLLWRMANEPQQK